MSKKPPQGFNALAEPLELVLEFGWVDYAGHVGSGIRWFGTPVNASRLRPREA